MKGLEKPPQVKDAVNCCDTLDGDTLVGIYANLQMDK